jgi:hypothetical protein
VLERSIGVLSGRVSASAAASLPPGRADTLVAARLAAQAFGAGDVGQYEQLMLAGTRATWRKAMSPPSRRSAPRRRCSRRRWVRTTPTWRFR